jgi:hypothetical protein
VLAFEKILEQGLIVMGGRSDGRDKWQQTVKLSGFPSYLWENTG